MQAALIETGKAELIKEEKTAENTADEQDAIPDAPDARHGNRS